jgi:hypothetical protein
MDIPNIKGADAVWYAGDRVYCRLAIEIATEQKRTASQKKGANIIFILKRVEK